MVVGVVVVAGVVVVIDEVEVVALLLLADAPKPKILNIASFEMIFTVTFGETRIILERFLSFTFLDHSRLGKFQNQVQNEKSEYLRVSPPSPSLFLKY